MSHKTTTKSKLFKTKENVINALDYINNHTNHKLKYRESNRDETLIDSTRYNVEVSNVDFYILEMDGVKCVIGIKITDKGIEISGDFYQLPFSRDQLRRALEDGYLDSFLTEHLGDSYELRTVYDIEEWQEYLDESGIDEDLEQYANSDRYVVRELESLV